MLALAPRQRGRARRPEDAIRSRIRIVAALCLLACAPHPARAEAADYEERLVAWGLTRTGRELDPAPEGKRIDEILIASEEIVAPTDPYPRFLNLFHVKTQDSVIQRELLLDVGDAWRADLAAETERNLRKLFILAISRVVPVKGRAPGTVGLLVVSKDLWSIRLNSQFNLVGSLLQYLRIRPTEQNFLGLNKQLSLDFVLKLDTVSFGQAYTDPRLFGTRLALAESFAVILNRQTGAPEGSRGGLSLTLPLYSLASEHGFTAGASWLTQRTRVFRGASVWQLPYPDADAPTGSVPYVYDARDVEAAGSYTRSLGSRYKTNLSVGLGGYARRYGAPPDADLTQDQRDWLAARYLPRSESAVYLSASALFFEANYRVLHNVSTFALSEDYQLGHRVLLTARWADPFLLSPQRFGELGASARYRWLVADNLLTVEGAAAARFVPGATGTGLSGPWVNKEYAFQLENVSPLVGIGRFVVRGLVDLRYDDLDHQVFLLGGGNGLRGVTPEALSGTRMALFNLEYRTRPIELYTLHAGLVLFWDAGSAFDRSPALAHTVGIGLRLLFPQFDVEPMRIDFGWVINQPAPPLLGRFSASFGQVDDYRPTFLSSPLD